MSYPKRAKGWRRITVENQKFRWCLKISRTNTVTMRGPTSSGQHVVVTLNGWYHVWDFLGNFDKLPNNPRIITGNFVTQAIKFALKCGWNPMKTGAPLRLNYDNNSCVLSHTIGEKSQSIVIDTEAAKNKTGFPLLHDITDLVLKKE